MTTTITWCAAAAAHTVDVDCARGQAPCLDLPEQHGFAIDEADVTYWGTCPDCQSQTTDERSAA